MIYIGDTHGNNDYIKMLIRDRDYKNMDLIHVGDFGVGFKTMGQDIEELEALNDFMCERGLTLHVIHGNHDNPHYFDGTYIYTNLKLHPDYTILNIEGKNVLLVGGAISIDRVPRRKANLDAARVGKENRYHWEHEKFVLDKEKLEGMVGTVDIVVTHTAPHYAKPFDVGGNWPYIVKQFMDDDPTLGEDLIEERNQLNVMYDILDKNNYVEHWFYGHFHQTQWTNHGTTLFRMLAIDEVYHHEIRDDDYEEEMNKKYGE